MSIGPEIKECQNCRKDFVIETEDFAFYDKIQVPPPTFCPECRMIRRMAWRNQRSLYKRECDLCKKSIVSMYSKEVAFPVYCNPCFYSDGWDPSEYALEIDWSKPFLDQWYILWNMVPKFALLSWGNSKNSEYANVVINSTNCYLTYSVTDSENVFFSENIDKSKSMVDCYMSIDGCDSCYYNQGKGNYGCKYVSQCANSINCSFCFDCTNCQDCFMSVNLRNRKYVFRGVQLSKEEYEEALEKENLGSRKSLERLYIEWKELNENKAIHQHARIVGAENATGNFIRNAKNIKACFNLYNSENVAYGARVLNAKDSYDMYGFGDGELVYETVGCSYGASRNFFSFYCDGTQNIQYTTLSTNGMNLFGCCSLRNKSYCILNKQYSKEEYTELVEKIKKHMMDMPYVDQKGRVFLYGEFFPFEMSPYGYNETLCLDFFPLIEEQARMQGYNWCIQKDKGHSITIQTKDIPDSMAEVDETILSQILCCGHYDQGEVSCNHQCTNAFKINTDEFLFYKKMNIPLPVLCPNCRHYERLPFLMSPLKLWHRVCMNEGCQNQFETSYAPERPEIVYCESCYQQTVL